MDWFPSILTTSLLGIALWLSRKLIETRLTRSVQHEFDKKLEQLRADLREREERIKADLKSREAEISSLRQVALNAMANRKMALDQRRLEAVDQIWASVISLAPAKSLSSFLQYINYEKAIKLAAHNMKVREMARMLGQGLNIDITKMDFRNSEKARPFISPMAWALFSAFSCIAWMSVVKLKAIEMGMESDFLDNDAIAKLVKTALPHQTGFIDKYGFSSYHFLLDELEKKLLDELQKMLSGAEADRANVEQASEILKQTNAIMSKATETGIHAQSLVQALVSE